MTELYSVALLLEPTDNHKQVLSELSHLCTSAEQVLWPLCVYWMYQDPCQQEKDLLRVWEKETFGSQKKLQFFHDSGRERLINAVKLMLLDLGAKQIAYDMDAKQIEDEVDTRLPSYDLVLIPRSETTLTFHGMFAWEHSYTEFFPYEPGFSVAFLREALEAMKSRDRRKGTVAVTPPEPEEKKFFRLRSR